MCDRKTCFANYNGKCYVLTEELNPCSFYKRNRDITNGVRYEFIPRGGYQSSITVNGTAIKDYRVKYGYTQETFAELIGVSRSTIVHWERGYVSIPADWVRILRQLGVRLKEGQHERDSA